MIVFTFPGQGSQKPGMGAAWVGHPSWELVVEASALAGRDLARLLLEADADELRATRNSQLATFLASLVVLDAVERVGVEPAAVAGHSLGEYTGMVAAGAVSFEEGVRLVAERGEAMQDAADGHVGTMSAVLGLDDDQVEVACSTVDGDVWVANYNAPGQVVIAGSPDALDQVAAIARSRGAKKVMPLPVGGAFHTPFMAPARERLRRAIADADLRDPDLPVYANVDARAHRSAEDWAGLLAAQLCNPVRWRQTLHALDDAGATTFVELGPGSVLSGLVRRTLPNAQSFSVSGPDDLDRLLETLAGPPGDVPGMHDGEHLFATERLVVSPAAGVFEPDRSLRIGTPLEPGQRLGQVGEHEVRSPFTGVVMGVLAMSGERVTPSQPIAWLRTGELPAESGAA